MYADNLLSPWYGCAREQLANVRVFDCHTHVGIRDPSGFSATLVELLDALELVDGRAAVYPLKEPSGYGESNLRLIEATLETEGRLVAFARLDPADAPAQRGAEALEAGARGLKLHPAGEDFELSDRRLSEVWELADRERLPVVVHAGPELESIGETLLEVASGYSGLRLIAAHAALVDLAWLWRDAAELSNLFFDTSWWSASDVLALLSLVPVSQVLNGSDLPYCTPLSGALSTLRCSIELGLSEDEIGLVMGGQFERLVEREDPVRLPHCGRRDPPALDPLLERVYVYLTAALEPMQRGEEPEQMLVLAQHAAKVRGDDSNAEVMQSIAELLELYERQRETLKTNNQYAPGWDLIAAATLLARTPKAPVPSPVTAEAGS
jgi:hypothetical protein